MKSLTKRIISLILTIVLLVTSVVIVSADEATLYLSELRIVYANSVDEAADSLKGGEFDDYVILPYNLNADTDEVGVYLAYKTTTDVNDAITDLSVMQMKGGYREGQYQAMLEQSLDQYNLMSEVYLRAIEYFAMAYAAGDILADAAYRQLNFYNDPDDHDGALIGDLFIEGIDASELAVIFMEGNSYALNNIRSLLAMGVSYNESGLTYFEAVAEAAAVFEEDEYAFEDNDNYSEFDSYALIIGAVFTTFKEMFAEYESIEDELNFEDEEFTDLEIRYLEYAFLASMFRNTEYLGGETLYKFTVDYDLDEENLEELYPLVYALNDGQLALTQVNHYYDVVRYSVSEFSEEKLEEELLEAEEENGDDPFSIYLGVDRSIYEGNFALTSEAFRADSYNESGFDEWLVGEHGGVFTSLISATATSALLFVGGIYSFTQGGAGSGAATGAAVSAVKTKAIAAADKLASTMLPKSSYVNIYNPALHDFGDAINYIYLQHYTSGVDALDASFSTKLDFINKLASDPNIPAGEKVIIGEIQKGYAAAKTEVSSQSGQVAAQKATTTVASSVGGGVLTAVFFIASAALMLYTAITLYVCWYEYRNPNYDDIPSSLVDLVVTEDGDRYVKYDAVLESDPDGDGEYFPGDLNAFTGERWNALYYTKSYEAGKPLLADFVHSTSNNVAPDGYAPVAKFGEEKCYNLNRYQFYPDVQSVYLSVKQSDAKKDAQDAPGLVGSMIGNGFYLLAAVGGAVAGVGATFGIQQISKKKRKATEDAPEGEEK